MRFRRVRRTRGGVSENSPTRGRVSENRTLWTSCGTTPTKNTMTSRPTTTPTNNNTTTAWKKRGRSELGEDPSPKSSRASLASDISVAHPVHPPGPNSNSNSIPNVNQQHNSTRNKYYEYCKYRDYSSELIDPEPHVPLTKLGRIPNFPTKMHSILSRPDLRPVIAWMPHGRSWKVLDPTAFERDVLPKYFKHSRISSFVRQANGWGFRRITQKGPDENSYYHEMFLRGLPHLCKKMKRPKGSTKQDSYPIRDPDLYQISRENPILSLLRAQEAAQKDDHIRLQHVTDFLHDHLKPSPTPIAPTPSLPPPPSITTGVADRLWMGAASLPLHARISSPFSPSRVSSAGLKDSNLSYPKALGPPRFQSALPKTSPPKAWRHQTNSRSPTTATSQTTTTTTQAFSNRDAGSSDSNSSPRSESSSPETKLVAAALANNDDFRDMLVVGQALLRLQSHLQPPPSSPLPPKSHHKRVGPGRCVPVLLRKPSFTTSRYDCGVCYF